VTKRVRIRYFAALREQRGVGEEEVDTAALTAAELYLELRRAHGFTLEASGLRLAVNDAFQPWATRIRDGDALAFIPPFAGG
jgi:molybdopterin converting factor small subunit